MCHHATCVKEKTEIHLYIQSMEKVSSALVCRAATLHPLATRVPALCLEASVPVDRDTIGILKLAFMTRRPKLSRWKTNSHFLVHFAVFFKKERKGLLP